MRFGEAGLATLPHRRTTQEAVTVAERRSTTVDGFRLSYVVGGAGPTIVLLPGWMMTSRWFVEDGTFADLSSDHRVIAADPLGCGHSDQPTGLEHYVDDRLVDHLAGVLDAEAVTESVLWGYGRGATIAHLYARRRPDQVRLVVYEHEYVGTDRRALDGSLLDIQGQNARLEAALDERDWSAVWEVIGRMPDDLRRRVERDNDPAALATVLRAGQRRPAGFFPSSVDTVALWGKDDDVAPRNLEVIDSLPIRFEVIAGDRFSNLRSARQRIAAVRGYLERLDGSGDDSGR